MVLFFLFHFFYCTLHINVFVCHSPALHSFIHFYFGFSLSLIRMRAPLTQTKMVCFRLAHIFSENIEYYCIFEMLWIFFSSSPSIFGCSMLNTWKPTSTLRIIANAYRYEPKLSRSVFGWRSSASLFVFTVHFHIFCVHSD